MIRQILFPAMRGVLRLSGRSQRIEQSLAAVQIQLTRMETIMADTNNKLLAELDALKAKVDAYTTERGAAITAAATAARAAQKQEDAAAAAADLDAALAKIEGIGGELVTFSASGN